jgi:acetyltransferase
VLGVPAFPTVRDLPERPDVAVIVTPAPTVPKLVRECAESGIEAAIVISAGFKELGPAGEQFEQEISDIVRERGIRIIGPNCLGVMNPITGFNGTFAGVMALPGHVAFLSQSGALCTAILDWSREERVGFSAFVSMGSMLDVSWGDLIEYFGRDTNTRAILLYMETVGGDARAFLSAARQVAQQKPIIAIKAGRTPAAAKAAASHTGSLAGSDQAFDAALDRAGILRVERIADLFSLAEALGKQPLPKGKRLTILTNAGGPAVLAVDALVDGGGLPAELSSETHAALSAFLPPHWSRNNPIDILGDAGPDRYAQALSTAAQDPGSDGLLVILTPQDMTDPTQTAAQLCTAAKTKGKVVLASWMGGPTVAEGRRLLNQASIPTFDYPDTAARAFNYLWQYGERLKNIYETPELVLDDVEGTSSRSAEASQIIHDALSQQRTLLTEAESKQLLAIYQIPTVPTRVARSTDEAAAIAAEYGFPVAIKLHSLTYTHKTDVGGIRLNVPDADAVRVAFREIEEAIRKRAGEGHFQGVAVQPMIQSEGYELILGSTVDEQFGPTILFGSGGQLVEVYRDRAVALPPLNATLAQRLMEKTKIFKALLGVRGRPPVNFPELHRALIRFGTMIIEQPRIKECDINPLLASPRGVLALDARVVLYGSEEPLESLPRPAVRPYPTQYITRAELRNGTQITIRPIRLEDETLMVEFHQSLSPATVHSRYWHVMNLGHRTSHQRLVRVCDTDFDREVAIVAENINSSTGKRQIIGVGRLSRDPGADDAEFAMLIRDDWQGLGAGTRLLSQLIEIGRRERIHKIYAHILADNQTMQSVCQQLGFSLSYDAEAREVRAELQVIVE